MQRQLKVKKNLIKNTNKLSSIKKVMNLGSGINIC